MLIGEIHDSRKRWIALLEFVAYENTVRLGLFAFSSVHGCFNHGSSNFSTDKSFSN
jgi:hypothetical protein